MSNFLKYLLFAVLAVVVLSGVMLWWKISNTEGMKKDAVEAVALITGRTLEINGPLEINIESLLSRTTIVVHDFSLSNAEWSDPEPMLEGKRISVSVDPSKLLSKHFYVHDIQIDGVTIRLDSDEDGTSNWDIMPATAGSDEDPPQLTIEHLQLERFHVTIDSEDRDSPFDISIANLKADRQPDRQIAISAAGIVNDQEMTLNGTAGPLISLIEGGEFRQELELTVGDNLFDSEGSTSDFGEATDANIHVRITGPEIGTVINDFNLPAFSEGAFDFKLDVETTNGASTIDVMGDLGSLDIVASGQLDNLRDPKQGDLTLSLSGPDLNALGQTVNIDNLAQSPYQLNLDLGVESGDSQIRSLTMTAGSTRIEASGRLGKFPELNGSDLKFTITGDDISEWGPVMGLEDLLEKPFKVDGVLRNDEIGRLTTKTQFIAGAGQLSVNGFLGKQPGFIGADLAIEASAPDLGKIAILPGRDVMSDVAMNLAGNVDYTDEGVGLNGIAIQLGQDHVELDGLIVLGNNFKGSTLSAQLNVPDVAATGDLFGITNLPNETLQVTVSVKPVGDGLDFNVGDGNLGEISLDLSGSIPDMSSLAGIEANFDIKLPNIHLIPGLGDLPGLPLSAKGNISRSGDQSELRDVIFNIGSTRAVIEAELRGGADLTGTRVKFTVSGPNLNELLEMAALNELPGDFKFAGEVQFADGIDQINDIQANLGPWKVSVNGTVNDLLEPKSGELDISASGPDLSIARGFPGLEVLDSLAGDFELKGGLLIGGRKGSINNLNARLGTLEAVISGSVDRPLNPRSFDLQISAKGSDLSVLNEVTGQEFPAEPFAVDTHASGWIDDLQLSSLKAELGESDVAGDLKIIIAERSVIAGTLHSGQFDVRPWLPKEEEPSGEPAKSAVVQDSTQAPISSTELVFGDTPIVDIENTGVDVELTYTAGTILLFNTQYLDAEVGIFMDADQIRIEPFRFRESDVTVDGRFLIDGSQGVPHLEMLFNGENVRLGFAAAEGQDISTYPPATIHINLVGEGATHHELMSSLDGKIRMELGAGEFANAGLSLLFSDMLMELLSILNPFSSQSETTKLDCAVMAADFVSGKVIVTPFLLHTREVTIFSNGEIDLNTEKLTMAFNTKPRKGIGISAGVVVNPLTQVGGTLSSPYIELDPAGIAVSGGTAVATAGLSILAKSFSDRFLSSRDPCGDALKDLAKRDAEGAANK